jgi:hypothetical protein
MDFPTKTKYLAGMHWNPEASYYAAEFIQLQAKAEIEMALGTDPEELRAITDRQVEILNGLMVHLRNRAMSPKTIRKFQAMIDAAAKAAPIEAAEDDKAA